MSLEIIAYITGSITIVLILIKIILGRSKKKKYQDKRSVEDFFEDYKISESYVGQTKYDLFKPQTLSMDFIDYYTIGHENNHKTLRCKYTKEMTNIKLKIYAYTQYKELIDIYLVEQKGTFLNTTDILMNANVYYVNIEVISKSNLSVKQMIEGREDSDKLSSQILSLTLFFSMFPIMYLSMYLIDKNLIETFLTKVNNSIILATMILTSLMNYVILRFIAKKRRKGVKK